MRKFLTVLAIILIVFGSIIAFLIINQRKVQAPHSNEQQGAATQSDKQSQPNLVITDKLLPATSYKDRGSNPFTHIMLHYASNAQQNPANPHDVDAVYDIFSREEIGAHYYIDRQGKIYRFIDEKYNAYHAGSQAGNLPSNPELGSAGNDYSLGIELAGIGTQQEMELYGIDAAKYSLIPQDDIGFSDDQYQSLKKLLYELTERHSIAYDRQYIIGHDEYVPEHRTDPGQLFDWSKIDL